MATDIAFALGLLALLGSRAPLALKVFITTLAIADDLGAVLVIALFYTSDISLVNVAIGAGFLLLLVAGNVLGVRSPWYCHSGYRRHVDRILAQRHSCHGGRCIGGHGHTGGDQVG